jgi:diguanylate cyclase (GGDEF)-like protein/PAS domain S-box-containing protein
MHFGAIQGGGKGVASGGEGRLWALLGAAVYVFASMATILLTSDGRSHATVWPADAVILALMLERPRGDWPVLLLAGWIANLLGNTLARGWTPGLVLYGGVNMGQTLLAAWSITRVRLGDDLLADGRTMVRFLGAAGVVSPALGALGGSLVSDMTYGAPIGPAFLTWYGSNALGFVIFTPFFKALFDGSYVRSIEAQGPAGHARGLGLFALHAVVTTVVFGQSGLPLLFLPFPTLLLLSFGLGRLATLAGVMLVAIVGALVSLHHGGPMALTHEGPVFQTLFFQFYLAVMMCTTLPVAAIVASRAEAREQLAEREELMRLIMAHSPDAILGFDAGGICRWADGPVRDYLGHAPADLLGISLAALAQRAGVAPDRFDNGIDGGMRVVEFRPPRQPHLTVEASLRVTRQGRGGALGSVVTLRDISLRKAREEAISRRAEIDDLTGVFNRAGFRQRLTRAIEQAGEQASGGSAMTLALIDVDHFKAINDTHGHPVGDAALVEIARRLRAGTRGEDVVGRLSGDEFAILFRSNVEIARGACERIVRVIASEPVHAIGSVLVLSSISCGLAELRPGMTREALFDAADLALYEAKRSGRNVVRAVVGAK